MTRLKNYKCKCCGEDVRAIAVSNSLDEYMVANWKFEVTDFAQLPIEAQLCLDCYARKYQLGQYAIR